MADPEGRLRAGDLSGCLAELQDQVRRNPADPKLRTFLSQVFMVTGDWERAVTQLAVLGEMDASAIPMAHAYRAAIQCEQVRSSVFKGERSPVIFGEPEPWMALLVEAVTALARGAHVEAARLRTTALESAPASRGSINGQAFEWIADADSRLGPMFEVLLNGALYWVPFHRIARVVMEPPADLRDLLWLPAQFTWINGGDAVGLIPVRYPGTEQSPDNPLRLARRTDWIDAGSETFVGLGQRVLATSEVELPLLEVREIALHAATG